MPIVAHGYGRSVADFSFLIPRGIEASLKAEPEITVELDVQIELDDSAIDVTVEEDVTVEVD